MQQVIIEPEEKRVPLVPLQEIRKFFNEEAFFGYSTAAFPKRFAILRQITTKKWGFVYMEDLLRGSLADSKFNGEDMYLALQNAVYAGRQVFRFEDMQEMFSFFAKNQQG